MTKAIKTKGLPEGMSEKLAEPLDNDMLVFDTSEATKTRHIKIDGTIYKVRPLGAEEYLKIQGQSQKIQTLQIKGATQKALDEMQDILDALIIPLFKIADDMPQPNDPQDFAQHVKEVKDKSYFAYRSLMNDLIATVIPNVKKTPEQA